MNAIILLSTILAMAMTGRSVPGYVTKCGTFCDTSKNDTSCKSIQKSNPLAPSGVYSIRTKTGQKIMVYCEMGLNGGGYTFIHPSSIPDLDDEEVNEMFTDRNTFLLRVRMTNGAQNYAVLSQLAEFRYLPLKIGLNNYVDYTAPWNLNAVGVPYLFFGFIPNQYSTRLGNTQGLQVNSVRAAYTHCDHVVASHFVLFPNFKESPPITLYYPEPVDRVIFSNLKPNPSGRVMPEDFFMFGEIHFGGCGCYVQSNQIPNVLSFAIGFK